MRIQLLYAFIDVFAGTNSMVNANNGFFDKRLPLSREQLAAKSAELLEKWKITKNSSTYQSMFSGRSVLPAFQNRDLIMNTISKNMVSISSLVYGTPILAFR